MSDFTGQDPTGNASTGLINSSNTLGSNGMANAGTPPVNPDLSNNVDTSQNIDTSKLGNNQDVTVPPVPQNTTNDFVNSLQVGNQASGLPSAQDLQQNVNTAQGATDQTTQQINDLMTQLGMKSQDTANLQQQNNISGLTQNLTDLNTQFAQSKANYASQFQRVGSQNIPSLFISGQEALAHAAAASDLGSQAAQIQAAQGNLTTAFNTINQTISEKYTPIQNQIDNQLKFYQLNKDKLSTAQSILATRQVDILNAKKAQVTQQQAIEQNASKTIQDEAGKGLIDPQTAIQIQSEIAKNGIASAVKKYGLTLNPDGTAQGTNVNPIDNAVVQSTMKMIGANQDMPVSTAISTIGMDAIIKGLVQQEGGTPQGTNNPGNIKFANQPGATKGIAASDGGNFANFSSPQTFQNAIQTMIQKAGDNGTNLSDFIASYKGVNTSQSQLPGTTGNPQIDTTAQGYDSAPVGNTGLTQATIDQRALAIASGTEIAPKSFTGLNGVINKAIMNRVGELNQGGNIAANKANLKALSKTLTDQTSYASTITRALETADAGFKQVLDTFQNKGINDQTLPIANMISNSVKYQLNPGDLQAFRAGLAEVGNEYSTVFSKGGTTTDSVRNRANDITNGNLSIADLQKTMTELQAQGGIAKDSANKAVQDVQGKINGIVTGSSAPTPQNSTGQDRTQYPASSITPPTGYKYDYQGDMQKAQALIQSGEDPAKVWGQFNALYK